MWALLLRRVRLVIVAAVLLPVVASVSRRIAERLEKDGPTAASRSLHLVERTAGRARALVR